MGSQSVFGLFHVRIFIAPNLLLVVQDILHPIEKEDELVFFPKLPLDASDDCSEETLRVRLGLVREATLERLMLMIACAL